MRSNLGYHFHAIIDELSEWFKHKNIYFKSGLILIVISIVFFLIHGIFS